jgi:hypothetical protein
MVRLAQIVHLPCNDTNPISKRIENEILLEPRHLELSSGASKMISEHLIHSVQSVYQSCVKFGIISKRTETSIHLGLVTKEYHQVRPKQFLSLLYVWCKPCIYLAPTLIQPPNGQKRDSTWPTSPRGSIWCVQNDFWAYGTFITNHALILHQE